ncbi:hypothetical protein ACFL6Y_03065 [Elusimicrobiota bacterium]
MRKVILGAAFLSLILASQGYMQAAQDPMEEAGQLSGIYDKGLAGDAVQVSGFYPGRSRNIPKCADCDEREPIDPAELYGGIKICRDGPAFFTGGGSQKMKREDVSYVLVYPVSENSVSFYFCAGYKESSMEKGSVLMPERTPFCRRIGNRPSYSIEELRSERRMFLRAAKTVGVAVGDITLFGIYAYATLNTGNIGYVLGPFMIASTALCGGRSVNPLLHLRGDLLPENVPVKKLLKKEVDTCAYRVRAGAYGYSRILEEYLNSL